MPSIFSRLKGKDGPTKIKSKKNAHLDNLTGQLPPKPRWEDAWTRATVEPEEIHELIKRCTEELKARALDHPFLLLPFRPTSDPSAVRTFVRHFFDNNGGLRGEHLAQELRMTEPMVISGVIKWCWSRLQGGIVGWDAYELFKVGEQDSNMARDSFKTFIPLSVENGARSSIIFDFYDLLSAIAAHGKSNGFGGRKLSRMAAWWTFEHKDTGSGFDGGYKAWLSAADATSHLFFAYLRSLAPQPSRSGISMLPMSLQKLLQETEYPPQTPSLLMSSTNRVQMIVDTVSPTPFALLRRANHFQYRDEDRALRDYSEYEDPVQALTEECRRVLKAISAANQTQAVSSSKHSTSLRDASWSRFEDIGFTGVLDEEDEDTESQQPTNRRPGLRTTPASGANLGRPTTPSWADFLSSGFVDDAPNSPSNMLLPPDKILPPIESTVRQRSSQSHRPRLETERHLEPGELASIITFDLDDSFWWVWMSSLAPEETSERKSAFGRCAVIETVIRTGRWIVMEEMVKGAAPQPAEGAYIAEKKGFFSWTRRNKGISRSKSTGQHALNKGDNGKLKASATMGFSKTSIGPDQQAKIQAAAAQLQAKQERERQAAAAQAQSTRRGRNDTDLMHEKTNSVMTLQPVIMSEASPAMKWANKYDKEAIREAYLANSNAGRGIAQATMQTNGTHTPATNGYELKPEPPSKAPSVQPEPSPSLLPTSPSRQEVAAEHSALGEKAVEAPADLHPAVAPVRSQSPLPPLPKDEPEESPELARETMVSPEPVNLSPNSKKQQKKLHKDLKEKEKTGGFRKLFGRNKRTSKLPENAAADLNGMLAQQPSTAPTPEPTQVAPPSPLEKPGMPRQETEYVTPMEEPGERTPIAQTPASFVQDQPSYAPSVDESISRVDTADAAEAHHEFSRFDQGPLLDQPAFAAEDSDNDTEDAIPPPIARRKVPSSEDEPEPEVTPTGEKPNPVPAQDRWAQIRKNAQERAQQRQSEEQSRGGQSKTTDGDDDTSGEETIESRVARIKARVAELTGNMEGTSSPGSRTPPVRR